MIREDSGLTLERVKEEMFGSASKVVITKDSTLIVTDGSTQEDVKKRVTQIQNLVEVYIYIYTPLHLLNNLLCNSINFSPNLFLFFQNTEENFEKKILKERIARLSGGIAIIKVNMKILKFY